MAACVSALVVMPAGQPASAANANDFDPGFIVSDETFYDSSTMTEAQIQTYLEQKVPTCRSGYICLKDARDNSRARSADPMCSAFDARSNERASSIIYRVSRACGINPKVLLVMLEKEQGLVTHTWPSSWRYDAAMGQGCPDTAACDPDWKGLSNQLFGSAWQLKRYGNPPGTSQTFTWYAPGNTWNIRWSPDASCGSSPVYIRNKATSALYYYTPYQPNAAALNNLYGTGDACSAYGNRNFWRLYSDWFGDPRGGAPGASAIASTAATWASGLGTASSNVVAVNGGANGSGSGQMFAKGSIYYTASIGAHAVLEPVRQVYWAMHGPAGSLGWPTSDPLTLAGYAGGLGQAFQGGSVYSSTATGAHAVTPPLLSYYFSQGGANANIGLPTGGMKSVSGGKSQQFQNGLVAQSGSGTFTLNTAHAKYVAANGGVGAGTLGWPTTQVLDYSGLTAQSFTNGTLYTSSKGTFRVTGVMRDKFWAAGTNTIGWPVGEQQCSGAQCYQAFSNATIAVDTTSKASVILTGKVGSYYASKNGPQGSLGWPQSSVLSYSESGGATAAVFANGSVYSSTSGTFAVSGAMRTAYFAAGTSTMGWPAAEQSCSGTKCTQSFQNGVVALDTATGKSVTMRGGIGSYYLMNPSKVGWPTSASFSYPESGGAWGQMFPSGSVYSSAAGTFTVSGAIRGAYWGAGTTVLGWPSSEETCSGTICQQTFQKGLITRNTGSGKIDLLTGAIATYYAKKGGVSGTLGAVLSAEARYSENGGATGQVFQGGSVYSSGAGTFTVSGAMRNAYWATGTTFVGWPTSEQTCSSTLCTQRFSNGTLSLDSSSGKTAYVHGSIGRYYGQNGGVSGRLGWPLSSQVKYADNGGAWGQVFGGGSVYSTATGTFTVSGAMRDAYWGAGTKAMGWPISEASCTGGICTQKFQNGTLTAKQ